MLITLYFIVTRLPDSLRSVRDHFLSLDPASLTVDLLEQHLLVAEASAVAVGAARGTPRPPFFEGCSPSTLAPSYASASAALVSVAEDVGAASASAKCHSGKGKSGKGGGGGSGGGGGGSGCSGGGSSGGCGGGGTGGGSGGSGGSGGGSGGSGSGGGSGTGGSETGARRVGSGGGQHQQQQRRSETQSPQQLHLLRSRIAFFDLDFDAIPSAMYALSVSAEGDCYRCVPPDLGIAAAALRASESCTLPITAPAEALHTFMLDSGASACFFRDSTTLTPLSTPVPVRLADPSGGPVVARSSTVLKSPAILSSSLSGLHLPSFSANLVSTAALPDAMVTTTTPGGQRVTNCTCIRTGRHLATFTRRPRSSLYTLVTKPPQVAASAHVSASGQVAAFCWCRLLSHQNLLWHHRLGHPSLPRLRGMHSCLLVSGLRRSLPPLPPSPAPPCLHCVEGRQCAAPHSLFPRMTAFLQTLHMDVKGQVVDVLIPWIRTVRLQLRERFGQDLPVLRLHSDRGGEFSSNLLRDFCRGEGILQSFTLPDSPQQNAIAERNIFLVMEVARTSMIHAAAPHFLWPFADVTFDKSVPFYRLFPNRSAPPPPPPLFPPPNPPPVDPLPPQGPAPSGVSQVDPLPSPAPVQVAVASGAARGAAFGGATSGGAEPGGAESEGAETWGAEPGGVETGGAEPGGAEPGGAELEGVEPEGVEPGGAASEGAESGGAEAQGAASSGDSAGASPRLSPQQLREWFVRRARLRSGATVARGAGATRAGGARVAAGAGVTGGTATTGPRGSSTGADDFGNGGAGAGGAGAVAPGGAVRPRPYFVPLLQQSGGLTERREPASRPVLPVHTAHRIPRSRPPLVPGTHTMTLHPSSIPLHVPLPAPLASSLPAVPDPESDRARAASPTVSRYLATAVTDPLFDSVAALTLVAKLLDFAVACCLDYTTALVAESASARPPSVLGECALGTDVLEDRKEEFE
ncbi:unnamed protein product [Closterium sp. NIES-54]